MSKQPLGPTDADWKMLAETLRGLDHLRTRAAHREAKIAAARAAVGLPPLPAGSAALRRAARSGVR